MRAEIKVSIVILLVVFLVFIVQFGSGIVFSQSQNTLTVEDSFGNRDNFLTGTKITIQCFGRIDIYKGGELKESKIGKLEYIPQESGEYLIRCEEENKTIFVKDVGFPEDDKVNDSSTQEYKESPSGEEKEITEKEDEISEPDKEENKTEKLTEEKPTAEIQKYGEIQKELKGEKVHWIKTHPTGNQANQTETQKFLVRMSDKTILEYNAPLRPLTGRENQTPITETAIGNKFVLSSYDTDFELVSYHSSPVSQKITYRIFNNKPKNFSYVAIATSGKLNYFKAWHLVNKTGQRYHENITYHNGNVTADFPDAPILEYMPLQFDEQMNETFGNYTKVGYPYNETYIYTEREYDNPVLLNTTTNFLNKWNGGDFDSIKSELANYNISTNLSVLDSSVLPDNNQLVYIYKAPHQSNSWKYFEYETDNTPSKFLAFDPAGGGWWNDSWSYRQAINITNNINQNLTNFQIQINLNSSNVGTNFNWTEDENATRFTYYNATNDTETELYYWVEQWNSTTEEAKIWVNVTLIPGNATDVGSGNGIAVICLYYGNPSIESESNATNVFNFFDGFSGTSLDGNKWTATAPSYVTVGNGSVRINRGTVCTDNIVGSTPQDNIFEAKLRYHTQASSYAGFEIANDSVTSSSNSGSDALAYIMTQSGSTDDMTLWGADGTTSSYNIISGGIVDSNVQNEKDYILGFEFRGSSQVSYFELDYSDYSEIGRNTYSGTWDDDYWVWLGYFTGSAAGTADIDDMSVDWIRVRQYASAEPVLNLESEEYAAAINVTIALPEQDSQKTRLTSFTMNGTVNCTRGDCENVTARAQYLTTQTPTYTWTETTNTDFNSYNESVNISVDGGSLKLESNNLGAPWWDENWNYRESFNISNIAGNMTDYQFLINLNSSNVGANFNWNEDENATRFVWYNSSSTQNIKMNYWVEGWNSTGNTATIWANIPVLENNTNTTIYMYYGNSVADSESNTTTTFVFFDDFDGTSLNEDIWTATAPSYVTVTGGRVRINRGSVYTDSTLTSSPQDLTFEILAKYHNGAASYSGLNIADAQSTSGSNGGSNALAYSMTQSGDSYDITLWGADGTTSSYNIISGGSLYTPTLNTDYILGYSFYGSSQISYFIQDLEYTDISRNTYDGTWNYPFYLWMGYFTGSTSGSTDIDDINISWVRIRKYASIEPTYANGTEQELSIKSSGNYISNPFDSGSSDVKYQKIYWGFQTNENTTIKVYTRTSLDNSSWGSWFEQANNSDVYAEDKRYIQYRVLMNTSNSKQTPYFDENNIGYKITTSGWGNMSSGTALSTTNPYSCGFLNKSNQVCYPSWSITPNQVGDYSVRIYAGSPVSGLSETRNITVMANTYVTNFESNQSVVGKTRSVKLTARLLDDLSQPMEGYDLNFYDTTDETSIIYNYSSYPGTPYPGQKAYVSNNSGSIPPSSGPSIQNENEFNSTEYGGINTSDNVYITTTSGSAKSHRFEFNISENPNDLMTLYLYWEGKRSDTGNVYLMAWNYGNSSWVLLSKDSVGTSDKTLTYSLNSNFADYINSSGDFNLLIEAAAGFGDQSFYTDYVYINATTTYVIGTQTTNSTGYASITYDVPSDSSLGMHSLLAKYWGSDSEYLLESNDTITLKISSVPQINDINATPQTQGYGFNVTLQANVTDEVGVDKVFVNITKPGGGSILEEMANTYGSIYQYNYTDTWVMGTYTYFIWANNTDGISNQSELNKFYVNATLDLALGVEKDKYKANEKVYLSNCRYDWWNCSWIYRKDIDLQENEGSSLSWYPVNLSIDTQSLISNGKLNSNCSDLRFAYEKPAYELPATIDNTGYPSRTNETIMITVTDPNVLEKIESEDEIRLFNSSVEKPYESSDYLPFWVEMLSQQELKIWVKVNYIPAGGQKTVYMYYGDSSATNVENYNATFDEIIGEAGTFSTDHNWYSEGFTNSYSQNPVVVASMTTNEEGASGADTAAVARIRNLTSSGFDARAEEYPAGDGLHATENFSYVAIKSGTWVAAGLLLEAGTDTTTDSYDHFSFTDFGTTPAILTQINSYNETDAGSHTRTRNPTSSGTEVKIEEDSDSAHAEEIIGYIAVEQGGLENVIESYKTSRVIDDSPWYPLSFQRAFSEKPALVGKFMTEYGGDNMEERIKNLDSDGFETHTEETPSYDGSHTTEEFGYLAVKEGSIRGIQYKEQPSVSTGTPKQIDISYQKLPYWIQSGCNTNSTIVLTQVPFISANGQATIQLYYGNPNAVSESDMINVFSYSTVYGAYIVLGISGSDLDVGSYSDDNKVILGSNSITLDEQETSSISSSYVTLGSVLYSNAPVSSGTQSSGDGAPLTPLTFTGRLFEIPVSRYDPAYLDFYALDDSEINVYSSTGGAWTPEDAFNLSEGSAVSNSYATGADSTVTTVEISYLINSTGDILVFFRGNADDYMPLVPVGTEFYLEPSNYLQVGAVYNDTNVTIYYSDESSTSFVLNESQSWSSAALGSNGAANTARVVANNSIFTYQQADGDGREVTPGLPLAFMDSVFVFPQALDYFVVATPTGETTNCTLYNSTQGVVTSWEVSPNNPYPGRIRHGSSVSAGGKLVCNNSVYVYYERSTGGTETLIYGPKSHQKYGGNISYSVSGTETTKEVKLKNYGNTSVKGFLWMVVQKETDSGWQNIEPIVDDRPSNIRTLSPGGEINLTMLWNSNAWNTSREEPGTYRAYAAFVDASGSVLSSTVYGDIEDSDEFEIIKALLELTNLKHENEIEHSIDEYEVGDKIDWINITVTAMNNTALGANITLNSLDWNKNSVSWGPDEAKQCNDIPEGQSCERMWDNSSNGYAIPLDASPGTYTFYWNVTMTLENGDLKFNNSYNFTIHNIPSTFSSSLADTRLYRPDSTIYNFTFNNTWSSNITGVYVKLNCPNVNGFVCDCDYGSQSGDACYLGEVSAGETVPFNISVNGSTPIDDYIVNITLNYTNPGSEYREWVEYESKTIEVRSPNLLEITLYNITENYTRGYLYNLSAYANNTASSTADNVWLNYTIPSGWINISGSLNQYGYMLNPSEIIWNNITANISHSSSLGEQQVRLDSESDQGQEDWKIKTVYVWAETSLTGFQANDSTPDMGDTVELQVRLIYDNGSLVSGQTVYFNDENESLYIGSGVTNAQGWATVNYIIPGNVSLGVHVINASYEGSSSIYTLSSNTTTTIDVHQKPIITNITITPEIVGHGFNVTIRANAKDIDDKIDKVFAKIKFPNGSLYWFEMTNISQDIYEVNLTNLWTYGKYNVTIWANDTIGSVNESEMEHFYLKVKSGVFTKTENNTYPPATYVNLTKGNNWWDYEWNYRKKINIENLGNNLSEYQILIVLNTTNFNYSKVTENSSDIRFIFFNDTSKRNMEIPYYIEEWNPSVESRIWVKVPYLNGSFNTTIYLYYGNPSATSTSNLSATFSYSEPRTIGYIVSDKIVSNGISILSLCDNNNVTIGGYSFTLNEQESASIPANSVNINDSVKAKCLAQVEGSGDVDDIIFPVSWAGTEFIYGGMRATDKFCMIAPFGDASVMIYDGGASVWSGTVNSTGICVSQDITSGNATRIESDKPILVFHGGNEDAFVMYPSTKEKLYGVPSNYFIVAAGSSGATISYTRSDTGATSTQSISADSQYSLSSLGPSGSAPAFVVNGSNPIGAIQQADHDGAESTTFAPLKEMTIKFGSSLGAEYIAIATPYSGTSCTVYDSSGNIVETQSASGSNGIYKICFDCGNDNTYVSGGWEVKCIKPVWAYYEEDINGDETNLLGYKQMRQYASPEPIYTLENEETPDTGIANSYIPFYGYLIMQVYKNTTTGWELADTVINETSPRLLEEGENLNISQIWDSNPWNTDKQSAGVYRVYAALTDINGNVLNSDYGPIEGYALFNITAPSVQLNITEIRIYNVTDNPNSHIYTGDLKDSGINKTFNLYAGLTYRIEIEVANLQSSSIWHINSSTLTHSGLNSTWYIDSGSDIWYSNLSDRSDTDFTGGNWSSGTVKWNTSLDGTVQSGGNATFYYVINITTNENEQYPVNFKVDDPSFTLNDYSTFKIIVSESQPPLLYNNIYNLTKTNLTRGESLEIYARWDEAIGEAQAEYNSTSPTLVKYNITLPDPNPQNWTNRTMETTSIWLLGKHSAKIYASDEQQNWNNTLQYLNFTVYGIAEITDGNLNDSTIDIGGSVKISCKVEDITNNDVIQDYIVSFYNSTSLLGTNTTNSTGWATYVYTDNSPGQETLKCNITKNLTRYYQINENNYKESILTTEESEPPAYSQVGPVNGTLVHKNDSTNLHAYWIDNYQLGYAWLATNETGNWENKTGYSSPMQLSGIESWSNFTWLNNTFTPGNLYWRIYANDSFGNENVTDIKWIDVWGWSEVSDISLNPQYIYVNNTTIIKCRIRDANSQQGIENYIVSFYNSTSLLGTNSTNSTGWATYLYKDYSNGIETITCNITDNSTLKYNVTGNNQASEELHTSQPGGDITPPSLVNNIYGLNESSILKGNSLLAYAQWDESLGNATIEYNSTSSVLDTYQINSPYTGNWTNYTISTDGSWTVGIHSVKIRAADNYDNWNNSLGYLNFTVKGRAGVEWVSPSGNIDRGIIQLRCKVEDLDGSYPIEGYEVKFYNSTVDLIGSNTTNSSGIAIIDWNASGYDVGPEQISCKITTSGYYYAINNSDSETLTLYGTLNTTLDNPENETEYRKGDTVQLNSSTVEELGNDVNVTATWYNSTDSQIATGENTTWQIPSDYGTGEELIKLEATKQYYHSDSENVAIAIWGWSKVNQSSLDPEGIGTGGTTIFSCQVVDANSSNPIENYTVSFYNSTGLMGTNTTLSNGWAYWTYTDATGSDETLICNITDDHSKYYNVTLDNSANQTVVIDDTPPKVENETRHHNPIIHTNELINLTVDVTDDNLYDIWAKLGRPETNDYVNVTMNILSGSTYSLTSTSYSNQRGIWNATFYANDSAGNENSSATTLNWTVWGWSEVTWISPDNGAHQQNTDLNLICRVTDSNTSSGVENYPVNFYRDGNFLSTQLTNSTGYANYTWNTGSFTGQINLSCNITDNSTLYYNTSQNYEDNTVISIDNIPPKVENETRGHNSVIHTNEFINVSVDAYDENLDKVWVRFGRPETQDYIYRDMNFLSGNTYWMYSTSYSNQRGVWNATFYANDTAGLQNNSATTLNWTVWGWAKISASLLNPAYMNSGGSTVFGCRVIDANTSQSMQNYTVSFYNSTGLMGTNTTLSNGWAYWTYTDATGSDETLICNITDDHSKYYNVTLDNSANQTVVIDDTPPKVENETRHHNPIIHTNELINLTVDVTDDNLYDIWAKLGRPETNDYVNVTMNILSGSTYSLTSTSYSNQRGIWNATFYANDSAGNQNSSATTLNWTVWGWSDVTFISPTPGTKYQQYTDVTLTCRVTDSNTSSGIENYQINFYYSNGTFLSSNYTDANGYASYVWNTDNNTGQINFTCNITDNSSMYYNASGNNEDTNYIEIDTGLPIVENETRHHNPIIHTNELINLTVDVSDDNLDNVWVQLGRPESGDYINVTITNLTGNTFNLTSTSYSYEIGIWNATFYANDTAGLQGNSATILNWTVWGWSNITWISPDGGNASQGSTVELVCRVMDVNQSLGIEDYPVNFYYKNSTESNYNYLNTTSSNTTGYVTYNWDTDSLPLDNYTVKCNITDNSTLYYNTTEQNEANTTIDLVTPTGFLEVYLMLPPSIPGKGEAESNGGYKVGQNKTFVLKANVTCKDGDCGTVQGAIRYNNSGIEPNTNLNIISSTPFYVVDSSNGSAQNPVSCGTLNENDSCVLNWTINSTGNLYSLWNLDVLFTGTQSSNNNTNNTKIDISIVLIMSLSNYQLNATVEPSWPSVNKVEMTGGPVQVTINENSNDAEGIYIKGSNLSGPGNYSIYVENMSYYTASLPAFSIPINETYQSITSPAPAGTNQPTYYWINTPQGMTTGYYYGYIYIMANATG